MSHHLHLHNNFFAGGSLEGRALLKLQHVAHIQMEMKSERERQKGKDAKRRQQVQTKAKKWSFAPATEAPTTNTSKAGHPASGVAEEEDPDMLLHRVRAYLSAKQRTPQARHRGQSSHRAGTRKPPVPLQTLPCNNARTPPTPQLTRPKTRPSPGKSGAVTQRNKPRSNTPRKNGFNKGRVLSSGFRPSEPFGVSVIPSNPFSPRGTDLTSVVETDVLAYKNPCTDKTGNPTNQTNEARILVSRRLQPKPPAVQNAFLHKSNNPPAPPSRSRRSRNSSQPSPSTLRAAPLALNQPKVSLVPAVIPPYSPGLYPATLQALPIIHPSSLSELVCNHNVFFNNYLKLSSNVCLLAL